ncbi:MULTISPECIES: hypothetical protein [unclassified Rhizobium]|uniref:hypothetical protein n=1 Tax=unclassified Rhizobium TaxID=2613769 RepID=UPI00160A80F7|nr:MULTISPECIES: hypothetical protein [unclassified Rhizobium]MBB3383910.1 hypothetical protein [Rhizobium sp. BK098]MBB3615610.1 hypothetical protein [Rhizobium sp. BK609]MBB3681270.1 hypothetical protein [Rhizobium sp. BK612]
MGSTPDPRCGQQKSTGAPLALRQPPCGGYFHGRSLPTLIANTTTSVSRQLRQGFSAAKRLKLTPIRASRKSAHSLLPPCSETGGNLPFHEMHIAISARISTPQCTRNAQVELIRPAATSYETFLQTFSIPNV